MVSTTLDRRRLLRHGAALAGALPLLATRGRYARAQAALPARRVFFENPDCTNVRLSPDGRHLAYVAPVDRVLNLWIAPAASPERGKPLTRVRDRNISTDIHWAYTNRHVVFFQERGGDENWRAASVDIATGAIVPLTPPRGVQAEVQDSDHRVPDEILFRHNARDKRFFDLYRINVVNGRSRLVYENRDYAEMLTDSRFRLRLAVRYAANGSAEWVERRGNAWIPFLAVPIRDVDATSLLNLSDDGNTLYMLDSRGRDKAALVAIDMTTRQAKVLAEDDEADIVAVHFESRTRRPLAALAVKDRRRWHAIDPTAATDLERLARYGAGDPDFVSRSDDNSQVTAFLERDAASGEYVMIDHVAGTMRRLFVQRAALAALELRPMQPIVIPARDGLALNGYLTMPAATPGAQPCPMVLVVHGGPYDRDVWGFSPTHQWLASRGYAVLTINYRGSTGFGKAFVTAADREWGGRMHDDLIDAVEWAIGRGLADRKRVAIWGGSYGGYSALWAATRTPEVFACIVDQFGISNLITFMATIPPYWGPWFSIWTNRLADPHTKEGRAFLRERSPISHIEHAQRPILIAQGLRDVRVVAAESQQMVAALKARGVPVTYLTFADEGHGFERPENRQAFAAVAEAFLAKHLGGAVQPIGDDLAGSTLRIETGGELIPALSK
jgi:dipeptidyl aminopeptidase/acylaminoacyl peptidase